MGAPPIRACRVGTFFACPAHYLAPPFTLAFFERPGKRFVAKFSPSPPRASKANRDAARARGIAPVIPHKANEKNKPAFFARTLYKARARIEQGVGRLKRFKRVALRCEKTARNFRSIVSFAWSAPLGVDSFRWRV